MFSITNDGMVMPTEDRSSLSTPPIRPPIEACCAARSSIGTPAVASAPPRWPTIICRRYS
jgi:hypothetical protein